jgi:Flp pilus assembly protein TadG
MRVLARRRSAQPAHGEDGQALVETALSLILALTTAFWLFELSMFAYTLSVFNEAAHEGVRYAMLHGSNAGNNSSGCSTSSPSDVIAAVKSFATYSMHDVSRMTVNVCYPDSTGSKPSSLVTMTVTYTYVPYITLLGFHPTMQVSSQGRILY